MSENTRPPKDEANSTQPPALPAPFAPAPGETPRAFSAFLAFFQLGHDRSLKAVAERLDESPDTVKQWSARHGWAERIHAFNTGLLQQRLEAEAAAQRQHAADWVRRTAEFREQEWRAAQNLRAAAQCFLESFGDREVAKMTLAQVSRALQISSQMARQALSGERPAHEPHVAPIQLEIAAALSRAYGQPPLAPAPHTQSATPNGEPRTHSDDPGAVTGSNPPNR